MPYLAFWEHDDPMGWSAPAAPCGVGRFIPPGRQVTVEPKTIFRPLIGLADRAGTARAFFLHFRS
jgi:hypothetical protein